MKQFKIFKHPDGRLQAVKIGWCWPAFFFGAIWALVSQLWIVAAITLVLLFIGVGWRIPLISGIAIWCVYGDLGNEWREKNLLSRHFKQQETIIQARSKSEALAIYVGTGGNAQTDVLPNVQTAQIPPDK